MMNSFNLEKLELKLKQEYALTKSDRTFLKKILNECFPGCFSDRIFYKQLSKMRLMAFYEKQLVGQVGIDHRVICVDKIPHQIFGIIDLCVTKPFRKKGIGEVLIKTIEDIALKHGIRHVIAFADQHDLYKKLGYKLVRAYCRFLVIEDLNSHSILEKDVSNILLIKSFNHIDFTDKKIDLLGYLF